MGGRRLRRLSAFFALLGVLILSGCGGSGVKTDYILAEKLWDDRNYASSAKQFERVFQKDQKGRLGQQALYRAATTSLLFLKDPTRALKLFRRYLEVAPRGPGARDAQLQIGEIYFSSTFQYDAAIQHYKAWVREHPSDPESPRILLRIGRAHYFLGQFYEALEAFQALSQRSPGVELLSEARYQLGISHLALAVAGGATTQEGRVEGSDAESFSAQDHYHRARLHLEQVERDHRNSEAAQRAAMALVTYFEEQGLWEDALAKLKTLSGRYPAPEVLRIREQRIRERLGRRNSIDRR